ncbi:hypothetical protein BMS3Bbin04_00140 [bacterium BMS3Bbin04]|nr:hypothetical protein BMS3Bbin04_00140 [bacterium BMS3Bbin04]
MRRSDDADEADVVDLWISCEFNEPAIATSWSITGTV